MKRYVLLGLLLATLALGGALTYVLNTQRGLHWALALGERYLPELHVGAAQGRLSGPLVLRNLRYASPQLRVHVARLELDWQPLQLFDAAVGIARLQVQGVEVTRLEQAPTPPQEQPGGLPSVTLPLDVRIDEARVSDIRFRPAPDATPVQVDVVALSGALANGTLRLRRLHVTTPQAQAQVSGTLGTTGEYPADLRVAWSLTLPTGTSLSGQGPVHGTVARLKLAQKVGGSFSGELDAVFTDLTSSPQWQASVAVHGLDTSTLRAGLPPMRVDAHFTGGGGIERFRLNGGGRIAGTPAGTVELQLQAQRLPQEVQIEKLELTLPDRPTRVTATGALSFEPEPSLALRANWTQLQWPPQGDQPVLASPEGSLRLSGWLDNYGGRLRARLSRPEGPLGEWRATAQGDGEGLRLQRISAQTLDGQLEGTGRVGWADGLSWKMQLDGKGLNPGKLLPQWSGNIHFTAENEGDTSNGVLHTDTRLKELAGKLRDYDLTAAAQVKTQGSDISIPSADLRQGPNHLHLSGSLGTQWDLSWTLAAKNLAALLPAAAGTLSADGRISGARAAPSVVAHLEASGAKFQDYTAKTLQAEVHLDQLGQKPSTLKVSGRGLSAAGQMIHRLQISADGTQRAHRLNIDADSDRAQARIALAGGLEKQSWRGTLQSAQLQSDAFGVWRLRDPVSMTASPGEFQVEQACWAAQRGSACVQGAWGSGGTLRAKARIDHLPLGLIAPLVPTEVGMQGELDAGAELVYGAKEKHLQAMLRLPPGELQYRSQGEVAQSFAYGAVTLAVNTHGQDLVANLDFPFEKLGQIKARLQLPGIWERQSAFTAQPMQGHVSAQLTDLSVAAAFVPELYKPGGTVALAMDVGGNIGQPQLNGSLQLANAHAEVPQFGLKVRGVRITVRNRDADTFLVEGEAHSGKGSLHLNGQFGMDVLQGGPASLHVIGKDFTVADFSEAHVEASPDLQIQARSYDLRVTGTVTIPQASLTPKELPATSVSPSSDVVIVKGPGAQKPQAQEEALQGRWQLHSRLKVVLGDKVSFKGFGLTGEVAGSLTLIDQPGKPTLGEGEVSIKNGIYKFYGRELKIDEGRVLFAGGPITNPGIQAKAVRTVQDVTAGVEISGDIKSPKVTLFSNPAMEDSDVLSYIVLGHPLQGASQGEGELLYQAARKLGLAGGGMLAKKLRHTFGLDVLSIESSQTTNQTSLVLGKYLSPRVYLGYAVGLFQEANILQLRYQIDKHWSLQTEAGTTSGGDILFSIEK